MKKHIFLTLLAVFMLIFVFAVSVSATELIKSSSDGFGEVNVVDGLTSTSSDNTSKVVLENADGTYSTFYTYYIYPTFNWRKDMTTVDFGQLNEALGTSYTYSSVIRLEALYDFEYHELKADMYQSLKEIHFPENSKITEIRRWYSNVGVLEKINIPASVTKLHQNAFRDCTGLKEVTFDKCSSLETITAEAFRGCTSLEEISLPDSVTSVGTSAFWGCTSLRTVRYGANLETFASRATSHTTVFYISKTTMKDFTGTMDNNYFGDTYTPKAATIFFTGNYDEALAFRAKATHEDAYNGTGGLSNAEIVEWNSQNPDSYYISESSWTIVYGYNTCKAFYGGIHTLAEDDYDCTTGTNCTICKETQAGKTHSMVTIWTYVNGYTQPGWKICKCANEETCKLDGGKTEGETPAIITALGYSIKIDTTHGYGILSDYKISRETLSEYNIYLGEGNELEIGVIAVNSDALATKQIMVNGELNSQKGIKIEINKSYSNISCVLAGFTADIAESLKLVICVYVIDADGTEYVQSTDANNNYSNLDEGFAEDERLDIVTIADVARITGDDISSMLEA